MRPRTAIILQHMKVIITGAAGFIGSTLVEALLRSGEKVRGLDNFVCGANRSGAHLTGVNFGRDVHLDEFHDLLLVEGGDPCPNCAQPLEISHGIEVGHIFKLGTKYSEPMGCSFLDDQGKSHAMTMGCYGLGIGRTVAAAIEQSHDEKGIIWPLPLAPFEVLVLPLNTNDSEVVEAGERIYSALAENGVDVLLDDRVERPGVDDSRADQREHPRSSRRRMDRRRGHRRR